MADFDVQQVVEAAARAAYDSSQRFNRGSVRAEEWELIPEYWRRIFRAQARAALAVIVPAVTEQVRALHEVHDCNYDECLRINGDCLFVDQCSCGQQPCDEARLLDELDAAARGEQP